MNRIRRINNSYQVLITPGIKISPDSSLMFGLWADPNLRGYSVKTFDTMNDAMCEAFKYPDIDWTRLVINNEHIFIRLRNVITNIINENITDQVQIRSNLMSAETFKNTMMDRVILHGSRFNLNDNFSDLISFTIVSPYSFVLFKCYEVLNKYKGHLYVDELRIRNKMIVAEKIIYLYGLTDQGTVYQIKLVPSLLDNISTKSPNFKQLITMQQKIDHQNNLNLNH